MREWSELMKVIKKTKSDRKLKECIDLSIKTKATIVCNDEQYVKDILKIVSDIGCSIPKPITLLEFSNDSFLDSDIDKIIIYEGETLINACADSIKIEGIFI